MTLVIVWSLQAWKLDWLRAVASSDAAGVSSSTVQPPTVLCLPPDHFVWWPSAGSDGGDGERCGGRR